MAITRPPVLKRTRRRKKGIVRVGAYESQSSHDNHQNDRQHYRVLRNILPLVLGPSLAQEYALLWRDSMPRSLGGLACRDTQLAREMMPMISFLHSACEGTTMQSILEVQRAYRLLTCRTSFDLLEGRNLRVGELIMRSSGTKAK